jgi:hypothetical protein
MHVIGFIQEQQKNAKRGTGSSISVLHIRWRVVEIGGD